MLFIKWVVTNKPEMLISGNGIKTFPAERPTLGTNISTVTAELISSIFTSIYKFENKRIMKQFLIIHFFL